MSEQQKPDNRTHAQKRIAERQEAMREYIAARGYLQQIEADIAREMTADELAVVKFKTEVRLKLLAKILPDTSESKAVVDLNTNLTTVLENLPLASPRASPAVD